MSTSKPIMRLILLCWVAFVFTTNAQPTSLKLTKPESVSMSGDSLKRMDNHFHRLVDAKQLAGIQTAVMRNGQLIHFDSYGYANIEAKKLLDEKSIFRIFSMTKPIVSVALMQLYEKGKFKLEDPIHKYLPEFKNMRVYRDSAMFVAQKPIRVIDLLRHTSGFSYGRSRYPELNRRYAAANLRAAKTNREYIQKLSKLPLQFEPNTDWQYGLSTNICGYLVEVLSGLSLDDYLQQHIFTLLGMKDTHFQLPKNKIERFTVGYGWRASSGLRIVETQSDNRYVRKVTLFNGGGGLVSTTLDYLKFCQMILNKGTFNGKRILNKTTVELMLRDHLQGVRRVQARLRLPAGEAGFGLGFVIKGASANQLEKVYGWGGAVGTYFRIDTQNKLIYILMIQLSPYRQLGLQRLMQNYVNAAMIK
ncbi:MAG TPA: hypothetical protein DCS93_20960 [Microscillaceae bacterium]|nr:hypothetical protein [Microscillaceae bacterium]